MNKSWLGRGPVLPCWPLGIPQLLPGVQHPSGEADGNGRTHCTPPPPQKNPAGAPHGAGQGGLQPGSCCRDPTGQRVGRAPVAHHPCTCITLPLRCGVPAAPQVLPQPSQGFTLLPVAPDPQCVTLTLPKPITLTVHFPTHAPPCSPQCLILHPSVQHPKSATAASPHPRGRPISCACSSFPDSLTYHPSPPSCMQLHAAPPSEPLKPFCTPHCVTLYPFRQCPPAANIWPRRSPQVPSPAEPQGSEPGGSSVQRTPSRLSPQTHPRCPPPPPLKLILNPEKLH